MLHPEAKSLARPLVRTAGWAAVVTILTFACWAGWRALGDPAEVPLESATVGVAGLACGPAALITVAAAHDPASVPSLRGLLERSGLAQRPSSSLRELADFAQRVGFEPIGLKIDATHLSQLPLPLIAHLRPGHFVVVHATGVRDFIISDQLTARHAVARDQFERMFSGYVLCLQTRRRGFQGISKEERNVTSSS